MVLSLSRRKPGVGEAWSSVICVKSACPSYLQQTHPLPCAGQYIGSGLIMKERKGRWMPHARVWLPESTAPDHEAVAREFLSRRRPRSRQECSAVLMNAIQQPETICGQWKDAQSGQRG